MNFEVLRWAVSIVFFAGFNYAILKQLRKDLNGLGTRVRQDRESKEAIRLNHSLCLMYLAQTKEEQRIILETLKEKVHDA